jgi:hypothetical protein
MVSAMREKTICAADDLFSRICSEPREPSRQFARPQSSQQIGASFILHVPVAAMAANTAIRRKL